MRHAHNEELVVSLWPLHFTHPPLPSHALHGSRQTPDWPSARTWPSQACGSDCPRQTRRHRAESPPASQHHTMRPQSVKACLERQPLKQSAHLFGEVHNLASDVIRLLSALFNAALISKDND